MKRIGIRIFSAIVILIVLVRAYVGFTVGSDLREVQDRYVAWRDKAGIEERVEKGMREVRTAFSPNADRCMSCHLGVMESSMDGAPAPLAKHPGSLLDHHPPHRFGCTACHDGNGMSVGLEAHGRNGEWHEPVLPGDLAGASCLRCHFERPARDMPHFARGKELVEVNGCLGCHQIDGKGGNIGPDLTLIGDSSPRVKKPTGRRAEELLQRYQGNPLLAYLHQSIGNPADFDVAPVMPAYEFSEEELEDIVVFLKGHQEARLDKWMVFQGDPVSRRPDESELRSRAIEHGRHLSEMYCSACHGNLGRDPLPNPHSIKGKVPDLVNMAERLSLEGDEVKRFIRAVEQGRSVMEGVKVEQQVKYDSVRDFILNGRVTDKADPDGPAPPLIMPSWKHQLSDFDIDCILAYRLAMDPNSFDEEWEEEED